MSSSDWRDGEERDFAEPDPGDWESEVVASRRDGFMAVRELGTNNWIAGHTIVPEDVE